MHFHSVAGLRVAALLLSGALLAGCVDQPTGPDAPAPPPDLPAAPAAQFQALTCTVDAVAETFACEPARPDGAASGDLIVGGQNVYVTLASSNLTYDSGTGQRTANVTVRSLIPSPQALGTADGTTLDPAGVRVFFQSGPTVTGGSGGVSVVPDGFATFTAASQPYYQYDEVLGEGDVSAPVTWTFVHPPTVTAFVFTVFVSAPVPYPDGWIDVTASSVSLRPGLTTDLDATVRTVVGNPVPGASVTWSSGDMATATIDGSGVVTAQAIGTTDVTATSGALSWTVPVTVTGRFIWSGAVSSDWSDGGNWNAAGAVPASGDSVDVPSGTPNDPALTAAAASGWLSVADGATLALGAHDLTADGDVLTVGTGGITSTTGWLVLSGASGTVEGVVPNLRVTGEYTLSGDLFVSGGYPRIAGGRLRNPGLLLRVRP